jgi:hypothetical protein
MTLRGMGAVLTGLCVAGATWAADERVYGGTFQAAEGRKGPIECELTAKEGGLWTVKFSARNEGNGPQRPFSSTADLVGKQEGSNLNLTGEVPMQRGGAYVVSAVLADNKTLKATFKKREGGGDGSFDLVVGRSEALAAKPPAPPVAPAKPQ